MPRRGLTSDVALDVLLAATCTRHRYTRDPGLVIDELRRLAGTRTDVLARVAGGWVGYYDSPDTRALADALRQIDGAEACIAAAHEARRIRRRTLASGGR